MTGFHFYLEKRNSKEGKGFKRECPVILSFSYSAFRIKTYTGRKIHEYEWDKEAERVKPAYFKSEEFNRYLSLLRERVEKYFNEVRESGIIPDQVQFQKEIKKMVKTDVPVFFDLLIRFIEENNGKWSLSTYKKMKTFYSQLKDFSNTMKENILPGMINQAFAEKLTGYYREKGLKDTSIKKNLDLLKWFMNWALRKELIFNRDYGQICFVPVKNSENHNDIYLRWEEIISFYQFEGFTKKEEWCRDIFCFIAFSGIRFSKLKDFKKGCVDGSYIQAPGGRMEKILLNKFAGELCKKYENRFYRSNTLFPLVSLITFHKHLRSAALKSGLKRSLFSKTTDSSFVPLHKLMSAQTAINTYFANMLRLDIPNGFNTSRKSAQSRIFQLSGALRLSEEKQIATSDFLYEGLRTSGSHPK